MAMAAGADNTTTMEIDLPHCYGLAHIDHAGRRVDVDLALKSVDVVGNVVEYVAAAPAERRLSYTGSMLPAANAEHAFDGATKGTARVGGDGRLRITNIPMPNSYYATLGSVLVPPTLYLIFNDRTSGLTKLAVPLGRSVPHRALTYPGQRTGASFYDGMATLPVRTQEQVLQDSAYCAYAPASASSFWGLKPPV